MPTARTRRLVRLLLVRPRKGGWGLNKTGHARWRPAMAYCSVFLYRVPRRKAEAFIHALRPIMKLFEDAGCLSDELLRPKDVSAKFGGVSLPTAIDLAADRSEERRVGKECR